jgi:hypothetical protein
MARTLVALFLRVGLADGQQARVKPALAKNHVMRPLWGIVNGVAEYHPEATYVLRFRECKSRKQKELKLTKEAAALEATGSGIPDSGPGSGRVPIAAAFPEYIQDVKATKAPKTWGSRKRIADYFLQSCHKHYLDEVGRRDLLDFRAFLCTKGLKDRSVFNAFQSILSTFRALGVAGLALKTDTPSFTERAVRAYSDQEVEKLFAACTADEKLLFQTFLFTGCREQEIQFLTLILLRGRLLSAPKRILGSASRIVKSASYLCRKPC